MNKWFDTSGYNKNDDRSLTIGINKNVLGMFKYELYGKIKVKFCGPRAKTYAYLIDCCADDDYEKNKIINKKAKGTKKCVIKRHLKFDDYKDSIINKKHILKTQQRFKSDLDTIYAKTITKIEISSNNDKILQTYDKITTYPHGTNAFKVCECEMLSLSLISLKK